MPLCNIFQVGATFSNEMCEKCETQFQRVVTCDSYVQFRNCILHQQPIQDVRFPHILMLSEFCLQYYKERTFVMWAQNFFYSVCQMMFVLVVGCVLDIMYPINGQTWWVSNMAVFQGSTTVYTWIYMLRHQAWKENRIWHTPSLCLFLSALL